MKPDNPGSQVDKTTAQIPGVDRGEPRVGRHPANPLPMPLTALLNRHRGTLLQYAAKKYSAEQIAASLKHPEIGISVGA